MNFLNIFLQELYDNIEKQRPGLFRLASDSDERDSSGLCKYKCCLKLHINFLKYIFSCVTNIFGVFIYIFLFVFQAGIRMLSRRASEL